VLGGRVPSDVIILANVRTSDADIKLAIDAGRRDIFPTYDDPTTKERPFTTFLIRGSSASSVRFVLTRKNNNFLQRAHFSLTSSTPLLPAHIGE
jgi:hypothetical protein